MADLMPAVLSIDDHASAHPHVLTLALEEVCPTCKGERVVQSDAWAEWWRRREEALGRRGSPNVDPANLEALIGPEPEGSEEMPCDTCDTVGLVLTANGRALMSAVRRHGLDNLHDADLTLARGIDRVRKAALRT